MFFIESERLRLIPLTHTQLLLWRQSRYKMELSMGLKPSNMMVDPIWKAELADALENWFIPKTLLYPNHYQWYTCWEAVLKTENVSIGGFGVGFPDESGESTTGYSLDQNYQNQGYGTEALKRMCEWGFENPDVKTISADTGKHNYPSQRILIKAGFTQTGVKEKEELAVFKLKRTNG